MNRCQTARIANQARALSADGSGVDDILLIAIGIVAFVIIIGLLIWAAVQLKTVEMQKEVHRMIIENLNDEDSYE